MPSVLLTGATGYIASHTWLALWEAGFEVVGLDDFSNSSPVVLERLAEDLEQRQANLDEVGSAAGDFELQDEPDRPEPPTLLRALQAFLQSVALVADTDAIDQEAGAVTLMTMHAAKGREWDVVILPAFEDEVTPSTRMNANVPEERRIAYVAATRARHRLYILTSAERTAKWGGARRHSPSRFIRELMGNNS